MGIAETTLHILCIGMGATLIMDVSSFFKHEFLVRRRLTMAWLFAGWATCCKGSFVMPRSQRPPLLGMND